MCGDQLTAGCQQPSAVFKKLAQIPECYSVVLATLTDWLDEYNSTYHRNLGVNELGLKEVLMNSWRACREYCLGRAPLLDPTIPIYATHLICELRANLDLALNNILKVTSSERNTIIRECLPLVLFALLEAEDVLPKYHHHTQTSISEAIHSGLAVVAILPMAYMAYEQKAFLSA